MDESVISSDKDVRGGMSVLRGTRIPISRIIAEFADNRTMSEIAEDMDIDVDLIKSLLIGMSRFFGETKQSMTRE